jgi:hypothetical protein
MNLVDLNNCFVQPKAVLTITSEDYFDEFLAEVHLKAGGTLSDGWGWFKVINVVFTNHKTHMIRFTDEAERDARFAEIVEQLKNA